MRVSPDPFYLTSSEFRALERRGASYLEWFQVVNELYLEGLVDPELSWINLLFDQHLDPTLVDFQRLTGAVTRLPQIFRADQSTLNATCEVQIPMSMAAWGFSHGVQQAMQQIFPLTSGERSLGRLSKEFLQAMSLASSKADPVVFLPVPPQRAYGPTHQFFADCHNGSNGQVVSGLLEDLDIQHEGVFFKTSSGPRLKVDVVYASSRHRCNGVTGRILQRIISKGVVVEPALNLLFDQKIAMALPFHPQTSSRFSDQVRDLFPETFLVARHLHPIINDERVSWLEFTGLSRNKRKYVLKYSGIDPKRKSGGAAVFKLSDCNKEQIVQVIEQCLADYYEGHPWIIQPLVRERNKFRYWDEEKNSLKSENMYFRLSPFYRKLASNKVCLIGFGATLSNLWKVSGRWDSVMTDVRIKRD